METQVVEKQTLFSGVRCLECGYRTGADLHLRTCPACESPWLDAQYDVHRLAHVWPAVLETRPTSLWRYRELLPFSDTITPVTMGEGWTPLTPAEGLQRALSVDGILIKDERQQPTGSFKDRQATCTISTLMARGVDELVLASTGNAAAAYSAYCARAGIKLWVFLTSSVPAEKMRELALYGAEVVKITGTYDQAKKIAADFAARRGIPYDAGAKVIPGKESMKTIAFEIAEQLDWTAPDWYVQAVSGGIGPLGVFKGFLELYNAGIIDRVPKLGIVQSEGCAPMVRAWEQEADTAEPLQPDTLVIVLATGDPGLSYQLLKQHTDDFGGAMVAVSDGAAFRAMRRLARTEGFSMEPASSVAFAGLETLLNQSYITPGERVVVNCSGHTFSAEKHALEDRYVLHLDTDIPGEPRTTDGLTEALEQLDEQITTIVIIDDNPHDSRLVRRLLQSYKNYRIFEANTASDGLDLVKQRRPDLVVLDLMMPDMDGFSVLEQMKAHTETADIPAVIISAKTLTTSERDYLDQNAHSVWQKGNFSARQLVDHVVDMLDDDVRQSHEAEQLDRVLSEFGQNQRPRILVVDDKELDTRLLRRLFESRQRFEVIEAHSGRGAMEILQHMSVDLLILDLRLPDIPGEELLEQLATRDDIRNIPTIVVSTKELDSEMRSRLAAHTVSVWSKENLDRNNLLAHVETILSE